MSSAAVNTANLASYVPKAILRYVEILFSIICFAILADWGLYGKGADTLNAMLAFGVLAMLWAIVMVICYLLQRVCLPFIKVFNILECIFDIIFVVWGAIVSIKTAADLGIPEFTNRWIRALQAAIAFSFLTTFLFIVSVVLDVVSIMKPTVEQQAEAAA